MKRKCSIVGCHNSAKAKGLCGKHYMRNWTHGDVNTVLKKMPETGAVQQFFEAIKTKDTEECIAWPFGTNGVGYGIISINGKRRLATRVICEWKHGKAPKGFYAAHSCGNGHLGCVNPRHISWKSAKENSADMLVHGTKVRGEDVPNSKLTHDQILEIRRLCGFMSQSLIAERFGVSQTAVSKIHLRKLWGHV